jgi:hypothetical protein
MSFRWVVLLIATLFTVIVWIGIEAVLSLSSEETEIYYTEYMEPIDPSFNEESLEEIQRREADKLLVDRDALE